MKLYCATWLTVFGSFMCGDVSAQQSPPSERMPGPMISPGSAIGAPVRGLGMPEVNAIARRPPRLGPEDQAAFDKDMTSYLQCMREHEREKNLAETADRLIRIRDNRKTWEELLAKSANQQFPDPAAGYDKLLANTFAAYKSFGGPAATVGSVHAIAIPCPRNPWDVWQETRRSPAVPIQSTARVVPVPVSSVPIEVNWQQVGDSSFANTLYVDPATIQRVLKTEKSEADEDIRVATEMINFKIKAPDGPSSYISVIEFDCKNRKTRNRSGNAYSGPAGTGKILGAVTPSAWAPQSANSAPNPMFAYVCAKVLSPLPIPSKAVR